MNRAQEASLILFGGISSAALIRVFETGPGESMLRPADFNDVADWVVLGSLVLSALWFFRKERQS
jgi:hypothetical protein